MVGPPVKDSASSRGDFFFSAPQLGQAVYSLQRDPSLPVLHLFQDKTKYFWTTQSSSCVGRGPGNVLGSGCHFTGRGSRRQQQPQWVMPGKSTSFGARPKLLGSRIWLVVCLGHMGPWASIPVYIVGMAQLSQQVLEGAEWNDVCAYRLSALCNLWKDAQMKCIAGSKTLRFSGPCMESESGW